MTGLIVAVNIAAIVLLAIIALRIWRSFSPGVMRLDHPAFFFLPVCLCLLVLHLPHIRWPHELNMDESQMLAQAMRFLVRPVPWRDVDGTTSGPLNSLALSVPIYLGAPANWITSRMLLWLSQCVTLALLYFALRTFGSRARAQLALLPAILFYAFPHDVDYVHYSSETIPVLLISAGLYFLAKEWNSDCVSTVRMFLLGCAVGTIPFAKMQAAPLAVFLAIVALMLVRFKNLREGAMAPYWWRELVTLIAGAALVPGLILTVVIAKGAFGDFWTSYILASSAYGSQEPAFIKFHNLEMQLAGNPDFGLYFASAMVVLVVLLYVCRGRIGRLGQQLAVPLIVILVEIVLTLLCFFTAGKGFLHYNFLLVPSLTLLFGLAFLGVSRIAGSQDEASQRQRALLLRFAVVCMLVIGLQLPNVPAYLHFAEGLAQPQDGASSSFVVKSALAATRPGESMAIWGWMPKYYVETGLYPGTRDAVGHYVISSGPYQNYFRSRYLQDLKENRPVLFLDAVATGMFDWTWTAQDRHECFPDLAKFIDDNYSIYLTLHYTNSQSLGWPVRLYVLKDRMAERRLSPTQLMLPEFQ